MLKKIPVPLTQEELQLLTKLMYWSHAAHSAFWVCDTLTQPGILAGKQTLGFDSFFPSVRSHRPSSDLSPLYLLVHRLGSGLRSNHDFLGPS